MNTIADSGRADQALAMFASACERYKLVSREMEWDGVSPVGEEYMTVTWGEYFAAEEFVNMAYMVARKYAPETAYLMLAGLMDSDGF